jgi:hypothetical protein
MRRHDKRDERGEGIYATLVALFAMMVLGAILMVSISSYATDTLAVTLQSNAAAVANRVIQTELVNQCGAAVGTEPTKNPLCTNGFGDFSRIAHSGGFTYRVDSFGSWMPSGGLSSCSTYTSRTPVALLESVFVSWGSGSAYRQFAFSSVEPIPTSVLAYRQSQLGGLCIKNASALISPNGSTIHRTGVGTAGLATALRSFSQPATSSTASTTYPDTSGNGNTATTEGGAGAVSPGSGPLGGSSLDFNGSGYLTTPLVQPGTNAYSEAAWFKTTSAGSQEVMVSSRDNNLGTDPFTLSTGPASGQVAFSFDDAYVLNGITSTNTYNNGQWHLAVGVWAGTAGAAFSPSQMTLYIDGAKVPTTTWGTGATFTAPATGGGNVSIGSNLSGWNDFSGGLAGVGVYNSALSASQVSALYASSSFSAYSSSVVGFSPAAYWPLQPATTSTNPTPLNPTSAIGGIAPVSTAYGWYPFLTPGTWTVTCNGASTTATVTSGTTTQVSC